MTVYSLYWMKQEDWRQSLPWLVLVWPQAGFTFLYVFCIASISIYILWVVGKLFLFPLSEKENPNIVLHDFYIQTKIGLNYQTPDFRVLLRVFGSGPTLLWMGFVLCFYVQLRVFAQHTGSFFAVKCCRTIWCSGVSIASQLKACVGILRLNCLPQLHLQGW